MISAARRTRASHGNTIDVAVVIGSEHSRTSNNTLRESFLVIEQTKFNGKFFLRLCCRLGVLLLFYWFSPSYLAPKSSRPFQPPLFPLGVFPFLPDLETFYPFFFFSRKEVVKQIRISLTDSLEVWVCDEPPRNETSLQSTAIRG